METEPHAHVTHLTPADRHKLDLLVLSHRLTITVPRPVLRAALLELDARAAHADMNATRLGAVLAAYAELDEAHAATLGELCGASFDLMDAKAQAEIEGARLADAIRALVASDMPAGDLRAALGELVDR